MAYKLPTIKYKGKKYIVDFRYGEMREIIRRGKELGIRVKFTELDDEEIKRKLRALRFRYWSNEYIPGLDD